MSQETIHISDGRTLPFYIVPKVLLRLHKPSQKGILTYNSLAYYAHGERCSVEIKRLGEIVGLSESSTKRGLAELVKIGAVRVKKKSRRTTGGNRMILPNEYTLVDVPEKTDVPI